MILIHQDAGTPPPELDHYLHAPRCSREHDPVELQGTWVSVADPGVDMKPPYVIRVLVDEASARAYERAHLRIRVPESLGRPLTHGDVRTTLWKGGDVRLVATCAGGRFIASEVQALGS